MFSRNADAREGFEEAVVTAFGEAASDVEEREGWIDILQKVSRRLEVTADLLAIGCLRVIRPASSPVGGKQALGAVALRKRFALNVASSTRSRSSIADRTSSRQPPYRSGNSKASYV
jgi:hypothetical protein